MKKMKETKDTKKTEVIFFVLLLWILLWAALVTESRKLDEVKGTIQPPERLKIAVVEVETESELATEKVDTSNTKPVIVGVFPTELPQQETQKEEPWYTKYQESEYLLAQILECEAGGEGKREMFYVGSVVLNRARTDYWEFEEVYTIIEVLYQFYGNKRRQQYDDRTIGKIESGIVPSDSALEVAKGLLDGSLECLPEYVLFQTLEELNGLKVEEVYLPGAVHHYYKPIDF